MDYLLVHGTTQSSTGYGRLADALTVRGQNPVMVDLPNDQPDWFADDYAEFLANQSNPLESPVVVAHSAAGLLLPAVARRLGARQMVWLAAYVPHPTFSLMEEVQAAPESLFRLFAMNEGDAEKK